MHTPQSILVVVGGRRYQHAALERAMMFAEQANIHIHLLSSLYQPVMDTSYGID
jgi:CO dehydrogenase/acetyl-CoA synthase epsilon subunit